MLTIHTKKNINFWLKNVKMLEQSILMILKFLLDTQMICKMFINTWKNTTQKRNAKY